jgi:hypothetical protein
MTFAGRHSERIPTGPLSVPSPPEREVLAACDGLHEIIARSSTRSARGGSVIRYRNHRGQFLGDEVHIVEPLLRYGDVSVPTDSWQSHRQRDAGS